MSRKSFAFMQVLMYSACVCVSTSFGLVDAAWFVGKSHTHTHDCTFNGNMFYDVCKRFVFLPKRKQRSTERLEVPVATVPVSGEGPNTQRGTDFSIFSTKGGLLCLNSTQSPQDLGDGPQLSTQPKDGKGGTGAVPLPGLWDGFALKT